LGDLSFRSNAALAEFVHEALLVNGFEQAWAERPVHFEAGIDNFTRERFHVFRNWHRHRPPR
jgi:hypothetical protein